MSRGGGRGSGRESGNGRGIEIRVGIEVGGGIGTRRLMEGEGRGIEIGRGIGVEAVVGVEAEVGVGVRHGFGQGLVTATGTRPGTKARRETEAGVKGEREELSRTMDTNLHHSGLGKEPERARRYGGGAEAEAGVDTGVTLESTHIPPKMAP